jgi:hypothetical protein
LKYGFNGYCAEAIGLIEMAVVKAGAAPEPGLNYDPVVLSDRPEPGWLSWPEYGDDGYLQRGRNMHGATVITNQHLALGQHTHKLAQRQ